MKEIRKRIRKEEKMERSQREVMMGSRTLGKNAGRKEIAERDKKEMNKEIKKE